VEGKEKQGSVTGWLGQNSELVK